MGRLALIALSAAVVFTLVGCGGTPTDTLAKSQSCLTEHGIQIGGTLSFVAKTADAGAFVATLSDNSVEVSFGTDVADAQQLQFAYERVAFSNVRQGLPDVLRRFNNVVTLWHSHPNQSDLDLVVGCLR